MPAGAVAVRARTAPQTYMQGVAVPAESVQPELFMDLTRGKTQLEQVIPFTGQSQVTVSLRKSDILSAIQIIFSGQVTIANGAGTTRTTARWPYDLIKACRFSANGVSNIINASGLKLKIREVMRKGDQNDRGVVQTFGGVSRSHGTLAKASESWGVGSNTTGLANGTYDVELEWTVPIAEDEHDLAGSIFLATTTADLTLELSLSPISDLFVTAGGATVTWGAQSQFQIIPTRYSIPVVDGQIIVPNLQFFHSLIESGYTALQLGENQVPVIGQGAGKMLLRVFGQVWNGSPSAPLAQTRANFGKQMWRFGTNETPDEYFDGHHMRVTQERRYNSDVGALWGVFCHDYVHENARRDTLDLGTTSEYRLVTTLQSGVALAAPKMEYVTETLFTA
jgi:hypothetical protein